MAKTKTKTKTKKTTSKKRASKKKVQAPEPILLSPSEEQKVRLAIALLIVFLTSFSLATGALQVGHLKGHGWHMSAFDINGQRRVRLLVSTDSRPDLAFFTHDGQRWNDGR